MNMLPIERIFVPLHHGSKRTRNIGLPAVAGRQRLDATGTDTAPLVLENRIP